MLSLQGVQLFIFPPSPILYKSTFYIILSTVAMSLDTTELEFDLQLQTSVQPRLVTSCETHTLAALVLVPSHLVRLTVLILAFQDQRANHRPGQSKGSCDD